jgi:AAA domain/Primase C terminal 2 (PriCT-2)
MGANNEQRADRQGSDAIGQMAANARREISTLIFEVQEYANITKFYFDYEARLKRGHFALVTGELRPDLDPNQPHQRVGTNFIDAASTKFTIDFDGLAPDAADTLIDGADAYEGDNCEGKAVSTALARLPKAFEQAACMVSATSSTGSKIVSTGKPSEGKARFRGTWETSRALTCGQQEKLAKALKAILGLGCIDGGFYSLAHFEFITRPVFLPGQTDPIRNPVYLLEGGLLDINAICAELKIDLDAGDDDQARTRGPSPGAGGPQAAKSGLALDLPPEQAEPLLRALLMAIGNGDSLRDDYNGWVGVIVAIFNASKGTDWGREIAVEWTGLSYDTKEVDQKWKALTKSGDGRNGVDYLIKLAVALAKEKKVEAAAGDVAAKSKAEELEAAVSSIDRARAAATGFPDDADTLAAQKARKTGWDELKEALRWPGMDEALKSRSNIAQNQFGFAQIGMGASNAPPMARQWITDRHARGHVSMTNGLPAGGKTKLAIAYAHAIATERPGLAGISEIDRHGAVAFIALDNERREEFDLEGKAFRKHHGLQPGDFKHRIHVIDNCGPLVERQLGGDLGPSRAIVALAPQLAWLREHENLCLIFIDTLLSAAGGADTSDGPAMAAIMRIGKELADMLNCSDDFINHLTKGGAIRDPDSMDAALGA